MNIEYKKKLWFYKTLFSYLPVFFLVTSILFLILFLAFSENIKKTTTKSNEFFVMQINQSVNNILSPVEKMVVNEMLTNGTLNRSFEAEDLQKYDIYEISKALKKLILNFPIIESAYIYYQGNRLVISDSVFTPLEQFSDQAFIEEQLSERQIGSSWTGRRMYTDVRKNDTQSVVSLVKKYPFHTGSQGLVVINIRVDTVQAMVAEMSSLETGVVHIFDGEGSFILSTEQSASTAYRAADVDDAYAKSTSDYTGWEVYSGFQNGRMFAFFAVFPYFWVVLGLVSIGVGAIWIIFITRRNYKPIETIMKRLNETFSLKNRDLFAKGNPDEIRFIELAIVDLMEQANKFQSRQEEDLIRIRKGFFKETVEGNRPIELEEWKHEMRRLGLKETFDKIAFNVLEIDKYYEFTAVYSDKDQYLLKFILNSVVQEIAQNHGIHAWTEWLSNERLGILYMIDDPDEEAAKISSQKIRQMPENYISWIKDNLKFTATVGIGGETDQIDDVPDLYESAMQALKYKPIFGNDRVIHPEELLAKPKTEIFNHVEFVGTLAHTYRSGNPTWHSQYQAFFQNLRSGMFPREDIVSIIHYFLYYLDRSMNELSNKLRESWQQRTMPALAELLDRFETLEEFEKRSYPLLESMSDEIQRQRDNQNNNQMIHDVRQYIDENYASPDLSLNLLSRTYNLSPSYLSQLFKDEFGEKFVDYLVGIRIEKAKKLLQNTSEPIQDIANKVGYLHAFSFIRAFKKLVGKTPGEFRK
ncbi:AraC family transcriptional regulator [Paenibacillus antri]|uniref:AraC family transcriptional regulator n=1 Tax=Paenibacillus antri TaxID=2582848 RepID=A0A5R9GBN3_9BACL|nr:AraC family transcriptional regulator [Paenibacillus antri]TLS53872.1 AraC family transcriptional regulator [Paenibacillus antri]